jgi:hypothetical protein
MLAAAIVAGALVWALRVTAREGDGALPLPMPDPAAAAQMEA